MKFSVLSWNVEHFKGGEARVKSVAKHVSEQNPDVFCLFEVENANVVNMMQHQFPAYDFNLTDGPQAMEMLVGHRRGKFDQVIFTQKREFDAFNPNLRPGALLTVRKETTFSNILFLHTDSGTTAPDFGNRQEMFEKILRLKKGVDRLSENSQGRLLVLGDLNTMGLFYPTRRIAHLRISAAEEIHGLDTEVGKVQMGLLLKDFAHTFNNGSLQSDLDHVLASNNLQLKVQGTTSDGLPVLVKVRGWQQLTGAARKKFIDEISDHCSVMVEVEA